MDWLEEELGGFEDDYLVFDCPGALITLYTHPLYLTLVVSKGQIELYTHHSFLPTLVRNLSRMGIRTSAVYLLDSQFMEDRYKFFRYLSPPNLA
jgi:GPN-loop GTPase